MLFACSLKEVSSAHNAVHLCLHPLTLFHNTFQIPCQVQTIQNSQRCYLPKSFMETGSKRDKEGCNNASTRHQCNLTFLRHQIIHTGRKHYKFHNCMKTFNLVFMQKNPMISGIKDLSHELQTHRKAAPLI